MSKEDNVIITIFSRFSNAFCVGCSRGQAEEIARTFNSDAEFLNIPGKIDGITYEYIIASASVYCIGIEDK